MEVYSLFTNSIIQTHTKGNKELTECILFSNPHACCHLLIKWNRPYNVNFLNYCLTGILTFVHITSKSTVIQIIKQKYTEMPIDF